MRDCTAKWPIDIDWIFIGHLQVLWLIVLSYRSDNGLPKMCQWPKWHWLIIHRQSQLPQRHQLSSFTTSVFRFWPNSSGTRCHTFFYSASNTDFMTVLWYCILTVTDSKHRHTWKCYKLCRSNESATRNCNIGHQLPNLSLLYARGYKRAKWFYVVKNVIRRACDS